MQKYINNVAVKNGARVLTPLVGGLVTVTTIAGAAATLYDANGGLPRTTPLLTDINGAFSFYAPDGRYTITITGAGIVPITISDVLLEDPNEGVITPTDGSVTNAKVAAGVSASKISAIQSGIGAVAVDLQTAFRGIPSIEQYGAVRGQDCYEAINKALAAHATVFVPAGTWLTSAGAAGKPSHVIKNKCLIGVSREISIIQATGTNEGRTLFVNGVTDVNTPGTWGSGQDFRIENLWIRGNWDAATGLTSVTETVNGSPVSAPVGILKAAHNPATQTALIKGVSAVYTVIKNCYIDNAYEHGVLLYRNGYSEIASNIFARCRGAGLWLTADSAAAAITSTLVSKNQFVACRGGFGAVITKFTYGCAIRDNRPFEDNTYGATFGEGADTDISGNYFEINPFGDAVIDPTLWGLTLQNNYWTIIPTLPPSGGPATRGFFSYDRKTGLRHVTAPGLGETNNQLGPIRYSCDSQVVGIGGTAPAASGVGISFPSIQVASSDAYTLDDYAERPLTLTDVSGAGLSMSGSVQSTKTGRTVFITGQLVFPSTANTASIRIGGIPQVGAQVGVGQSLDNAGLGANTIFAPAGGTSFFILGAGTFAERTNVNFSGKVLYFNLQYDVA